MEQILIAIGSIITALGGGAAIKFFLNRRAEQRKANAEAYDAELKSLREQYDWLEKKYEAVSNKLDALYKEFRALENRNAELIRKNHELELALKEANYERCERPDDDCIRRLPPREKCRLRMILNGTYDELSEKPDQGEHAG